MIACREMRLWFQHHRLRPAQPPDQGVCGFQQRTIRTSHRLRQDFQQTKSTNMFASFRCVKDPGDPPKVPRGGHLGIAAPPRARLSELR